MGRVGTEFRFAKLPLVSSLIGRLPFPTPMIRFLPILAATLISTACSEKQSGASAKPETLVESYDEAEMAAATATAKSRVDEFLKVLESGAADSFSVKAPIRDGEATEHFWIGDLSYKDGVFSGKIGNEPGIVTNVKEGQKWEVKKDEISDWMYTKGDMIHGGFTIEPLLKSYPKEQADELRSKLVR